MCDTCGCGQPDQPVSMSRPGDPAHHQHTHSHSHVHHHGDMEHVHPHEHVHEHDKPHGQDQDEDHAHHFHQAGHDHSHGTPIRVEQDLLARNNQLAERNRGYFEAKHIIAINLVSSPGSGKTSLLEKTLEALRKDISFYVIEGDQQTMLDSERIHNTGIPVIQINTGNGCHLDAVMIHKAVRELEPGDHSILFIENVGNLVCPSLFDLGESKRVVIVSTTEGEDKPLKYPTMFRTSHLCVINKTDLLPYVDFRTEKAREYALRVNPHLEFIELSVKTGEGLAIWFEWLKQNLS
ncbi:MAG: hydrogenase nickel incorporation protein HypB [Bacteroidales bacterium]|nr:hydrogenase nickel incorporation protein HypB [Bacteroidales bacterium]